MCGLAGIISLGSPLGEDDVRTGRRMVGLLHHRGPDSAGELLDDRCYLGNTRLSIIDLTDRASLPMSNDDGSVWIAYNGEVTNFRELERRFGLRENYRFRSSSDTETVLRLYEHMGIRMLDELSGMFAMCIYDRRLNRAWVVRDFFGTRPMFHTSIGDRLYFSSEIKAFYAVPGFRPDPCLEAIHHFFSLAYIPGTLTAFEGVSELDGAHLIETEPGSGSQPRVRPYYDIRFDPREDMTENEAVDGFFSALEDAVRRNLISDAPVGVTLSGGLDSSSVLGLAKHLGSSSELHSFSLRINERSFDESPFQRAMARHAGSTHHEIRVGPGDVLRVIERHMSYMDEPLGDGSAIPFFLLAERAREHVKVLLSGEGGDEISNAYETHMACRIAELYRRFVPGPVRRAGYSLARCLPVSFRKLSFDFLAKRFTRGAELPVPDAHLHWRHVLEEDEKALLMPDVGEFEPTCEIFRRAFESADFHENLDRIAYMDLKNFFIGDLMQKNDRMVMAHSIEARFPFVDRLAFEFFATIPARYKIRGLCRRWVEKKAMARVLPPVIRRRQNFGIELPYSYWLEGELREIAEDCFSRPRIESTGFLSHRAVTKLFEDHLARRRDNGRVLWCILNTLLWHDLFVRRPAFMDLLEESPPVPGSVTMPSRPALLQTAPALPGRPG